MPLFLITLQALAPLFLLIAVGYGLKRSGMLHSAHVPILNSIVLRVTLPALVIQGLVTAPALPLTAVGLPFALLASEAAIMALAYGIGRAARLPMPVRGGLMVMAAFGNTGFLGYPMSLALHPAQFPEAILLDQFGMSIAMYIGVPIIGAQFGAALGDRDSVKAVVQRFAKSPLFLALLTGAALRLIPWPNTLLHEPSARICGKIALASLAYLGQGTTPIVLLALGVSLNPSRKAFFAPPVLAASALKLILCPLAIWIVCRMLRLPEPLTAQGVLSAAMPSSVMASVIAAQHDLDGDYVISVIFCSTILAAVTIPVVATLLR